RRKDEGGRMRDEGGRAERNRTLPSVRGGVPAKQAGWWEKAEGEGTLVYAASETVHGRSDMCRALLFMRLVCCALAAGALTCAVQAAAWPEKAVRIIIPCPPGGSTDIVGRIIAAELTARLKQQVVIDNRAGAGSIVGLQIATASPPDGYTFMMTSTAYGFLVDRPKVPVDLVNSFAPVAMIGFGDSALVVH